MNMVIRFATLSAFALLAGCMPAPLKKLDAPLADAEKADHVVILLTQSEVSVDDADVGNGGGGLLGALIEVAVESAKTKNRQEAIAPLRNALLDYQYEAKLIEAIKAHLPTSMVTADATFKVVHNTDEWRAHLQSVIPANVFLVSTSYAFEQDFDIAYVGAGVALRKFSTMPPDEKQWKKMTTKQRKAVEAPLLHQGSYTSQHVTRSLFVKVKKTPGMARYEQNAADWSQNGAEPVRIAFSKALDEIASLIQRDGDRSLPPTPPKKGTRAILANPYMQPNLANTSIIERANGRSLVVIGQNIHWIDDRQVKN